MNRLSFDIKTTPEVIKTTPLLEQNYSQIDREALALVFVLDKFHIYIYGCKFTLITDNRPLTRIFYHQAKLPPMSSKTFALCIIFILL